MQIQEQHINTRVDNIDNKRYNIVTYDEDNLYPQNINNIINGSGTAKNCTDRLISFLQGNGLTDKSLETIIINENREQLKDILSNVIKDFSKYRGFAIFRRLTSNFKTAELYHIPFDYIRLYFNEKEQCDFKKYVIYNNWDGLQGKININDFRYCYEWSDDLVDIQQQIELDGGTDNFSGQLLYYSEDKGQYPLAWIDPVQEDCIVDNQMKIFNYKNIVTNFMASHFLFFKNEQDEKTKKIIEKSIKNMQGAEQASRFNVIYGVASDEFDLKKIDIQNHDKLFEKTNEIIKLNIQDRFGQTMPIFRGSLTSEDISGEAIKSSYNLYNSHILQYQLILNNYFTYVLNDFYTNEFFNKKIEIQPLSYNIVKEGKVPALINDIGIGGVQALQTILSDVNLSENQKLSILQSLFGVTLEIALKMVRK